MTTSTLHEQTARLSEAEIIGLTDYEQPAKQLEVLHSRGFARAWIGRHGRVILERTHDDAVCRNEYAQPKPRLSANLDFMRQA